MVIGTTENFLLCISITSESLLTLHLDAKNSVTPIFFDLLIVLVFPRPNVAQQAAASFYLVAAPNE